MKEIRIIGLDPSLRSTGVAMARLILPDWRIVVDDLRLLTTDAQVGKVVRRNSDDLRRAGVIISGLAQAIENYRASFVTAEIPTGSQSARATMGFGMCVGVLAGVKHLLKLPIVEVQPAETKLASVGKKTATKDEIIAWAMATYPDAPWLVRKFKGALVPVEANEHLADAVAVIHAAIKTDQFQQATSLLAGMAA